MTSETDRKKNNSRKRAYKKDSEKKYAVSCCLLDHALSFEMRGCIQAIRANTELLKYRKAQTLDQNTITYLDKIDGNCAKLDELLNDCLGLCMDNVKSQDASQVEK